MNDAKQEILEAIHAFAEQVDARFQQVDQRFQGIDRRLDRMDSRMVDKSYLDDKLNDLRGDLVALTRKEDIKLCTLVDELVDQGSLSRRTAKRILAMEPFMRR